MVENIFPISLIISLFYLLIASLYIGLFATSKNYFHKSARVLIILNIMLHLLFIIYFGKTEGKIPLTSIFEAMSVLALLLTGLYFFIEIKTKERLIGTFIFPLIFIFQLIPTFGLRVTKTDLTLFRTPLFGIHTITAMIGYSAFVFSMVLGIMYLNLFHEIKGKKLRFMYKKLPSLAALDKMNSMSILIGFVFLTIGIISGILWARIAWKNFDFFDPKIFLSWVLWLIYLFSIFLDKIHKWSGKKMAYMSVLGFIVLIFTFIFVGLIFPSIHKF